MNGLSIPHRRLPEHREDADKADNLEDTDKADNLEDMSSLEDSTAARNIEMQQLTSPDTQKSTGRQAPRRFYFFSILFLLCAISIFTILILQNRADETVPTTTTVEEKTKIDEIPYEGIPGRSCTYPDSWLPLDINETSNYCGRNRFLPEPALNYVHEVPKTNKVLCAVGISRKCFSYKIADNIDRVMAIAPIYATDQTRQPVLYASHTNFIGYLSSIGIKTIVLEAIYEGQDFIMTKAGNEPFEIQLKIQDYFYHRENLLNVAARKTEHLWDYLLWIDGHQWFENSYWWEETIYKLAHYDIVQLFDDISYLQYGNRTQWIELTSAMYKASLGPGDVSDYPKPIIYGNAWGMRKEKYHEIDHIPDECIASGCDVILGFASLPSDSYVPQWARNSPYYNIFIPWISSAHKILGNSNFVKGRILHIEHEHFFNYLGNIEKLSLDFNLTRDLTRDENFTLYLLNDTFREVFAANYRTSQL